MKEKGMAAGVWPSLSSHDDRSFHPSVRHSPFRGIDTLSFLNGNPESITREAVACMRAGAAHGGFVLGSGCALPRRTPAGNLTAARDAALEYGMYYDGILAERSLA